MPEEETKQFETGAVRSKDAEDVAYHLITPIGLEALARTYAEGAQKYSPYNWEKGMPADDLLNHAIRHIYKFLSGDRSEEHLSHAAWNVLAAIHSLEAWPELNAGRLRCDGCKAPDSKQDAMVAEAKRRDGVFSSADLEVFCKHGLSRIDVRTLASIRSNDRRRQVINLMAFGSSLNEAIVRVFSGDTAK